MLQRIDSFKGEYDFLSNTYNVSFEFEGIRYQNAESAFQAQKCTNIMDKFEFGMLAANKAKRLGNQIVLRPHWESIKDDIMYAVVSEKFTQNESLKAKLLATGTAYLEAGNTWKDTYWGTYKGEGLNKLGHILMQIRLELK